MLNSVRNRLANAARVAEAARADALKFDALAAPFGELPMTFPDVIGSCLRCHRPGWVQEFTIRRAKRTSRGLYCRDCMLDMDVGADVQPEPSRWKR